MLSLKEYVFMKNETAISQIKWSIFLTLFLTCLFLYGCGEDNEEATKFYPANVPVTSQADSVVLAWDANTERDLGGYKVYYGRETGKYSRLIDVGNTTSCSISGLSTGTWYFAITALDHSGNESDYSNEVSLALVL